MYITCKNCNKKIKVTPSLAKRKKYCSLNCRLDYDFKKRLSFCKNCSIKFYPKQYKNAKYCSEKCFHIHNKVKRISVKCTFCGLEKKVTKNRAKKFKFCSLSCSAKFLTRTKKWLKSQKNANRNYGENHPNWTNGYIDKQGYKKICINGKQIREHRHIMQQYIGRKLNKEEHVHHIDCNKLNNKINNLKIMGIKEHSLLHAKLRKEELRKK